MHPFENLFHVDMHMDDGNMLKKFQQILVHSFLENRPPSPTTIFKFYRDSYIHWPKCFYGELHKDDRNMLRNFQVNPVNHVGDMSLNKLLQGFL